MYLLILKDSQHKKHLVQESLHNPVLGNMSNMKKALNHKVGMRKSYTAN